MLRQGRGVGGFGDVAFDSARGVGRTDNRELRLALRGAQHEGGRGADEPAHDRLRGGHKNKDRLGMEQVFSSREASLQPVWLGIYPLPNLHPRRCPTRGIGEEVERRTDKNIKHVQRASLETGGALFYARVLYYDPVIGILIWNNRKMSLPRRPN